MISGFRLPYRSIMTVSEKEATRKREDPMPFASIAAWVPVRPVCAKTLAAY